MYYNIYLYIYIAFILYINHIIFLHAYPQNHIRILLFIKKDDAEGKDFYYIGKMITDFNSKEQTQIPNEKGQMLPVVNIQFDIVPPCSTKSL